MGFGERIYGKLPFWAQNVAISLYGVAWRSERLGGRFSEYVREFQEREQWPSDRFESYLERKLRERIQLAYDHVPYYRERWRDAGIRRQDVVNFRRDTLSRLPVTPKQDLRRESTRFLVAGRPSRGRVRTYHSSGSTGTPVSAYCTADDHRRFMAGREARSFAWAGVSLLASRSMIGGRLVVPAHDAGPPYYRHNWAESQTYFSAYHISPATAAGYVAGFNRYRPEVLTGYAQSHVLLAKMMLAAGLRLKYRPKALILSSEKLTPPDKQILDSAFGARAYEEYGAVENCLLATECEHGSLHCHPDFGIVEIVDGDGRAVAPGVDGRILCTALLNDTQQIIRYEIGDVGRWSAKACACGRDHLPVIEEVVGRVEDVVIGPDGRQMVRFHGIFINLPHVMAGQVIQESRSRLRVRVVPAPGYGETDIALIRKRIFERLGPMTIEVEPVAELERTKRGKIRAVISHLDEALSAGAAD